MRYLYFLLFIVFSSLCFSQNEIKVKMSYDENKKMLLVSVLNESDNLLGVNKGSEGLNELDGSIVYLSKTLTDGAMNQLKTFLWEYDADEKVLCPFRKYTWIPSEKQKSFAIRLEDKEIFRGAEKLYVKICFVVMVPSKVKGKKFEFKEIETGVHEVFLN